MLLQPGCRKRIYTVIQCTVESGTKENVYQPMHVFDDLNAAQKYHREADRSKGQRYGIFPEWK
jgi:hypothetical protein